MSLDLLSAFLIGLAGAVHCIGMCGGIAGAFSFAIPKDKAPLPFHLSYNFGRIFSYTIAGAIAGYLGSVADARISTQIPVLNILSAVFLLLMGLFIGQWWMGLSMLEKAGGRLWKRLSPIGKHLIPFKNPLYSFAYGGIWGWLPCGLVYSALVWSMSAGNALNGASVMFMFGLGTFPALLSAGIGSQTLKPILQKNIVRQITSFSLIFIALYLLFNILTSNN